MAYHLIDETGLPVQLQQDLINQIARRIAATKPDHLHKMFNFGRSYKLMSSETEKIRKFKIGMAPQSQLEVCYSVVVPPNSTPVDQDIMNEVECIRVCEEALSGKFKNFKIRLSSSAIIECIFEECRIPLEDRMDLLKQISTGSCKNQEVLGLFAIQGSCDKVAEQIEAKKLINKRKFIQQLDKLRLVRDRLKLFGILEN